MKITPTMRRMVHDSQFRELVAELILAQDKMRAYEESQRNMRRGEFKPIRVDANTGRKVAL